MSVFGSLHIHKEFGIMTDVKDDKARKDAVSKASGKEVYAADLVFDGMIYACLVRTSVPRGIIKSIKLPDLPEGYHYFDDRDIPDGGKNELWMIQKDWKCFAAGASGYIGETIGILCGPDRTVLYQLRNGIEVEYEEQIPAASIEESIALKGGPIIGEDNHHCKVELESGEGDIEEIMEGAHKIVEEELKTGFQEHMHLETNGMVANYEDGKFVFYASCQCPFYIRKSVAGVVGITPEDIIVRQMSTGGAFGGKEHFPDVIAGPLILAEYYLKKPIKLIFNREEDTRFSVKRHPSLVKFKTALDRKGNILAMDSTVYYNAGRYLASSYIVIQRGCMHIEGVYRFPHARVRGFSMATNTFPSCAFRGFGAPQTIFALETHLTHIAESIGVDPVDYKKRYLIKQGDTTITNGKIVEKVRVPELIENVCKASGYYEKSRKYGFGSGKGIGFSLYNHGGAFTGNGESAIIKAVVKVRKQKDGTVLVKAGQTEMGQGFSSAVCRIAAKTLGIPYDKVIYNYPDTNLVPDSGPTAASRSTMVPGNLVMKACQELKSRWNEADEIECEAHYEHPEGYPWNQETFQGYAYLGYGWGACVVEVEVDARTAETKVKGVWSAHDVGNCIDPLIVHGQVNGGIAQGIGWASTELLENNGGYFKQHSMSDYIIPTSMDLPSQEVYYANEPYQWGPYGAKGMGELVFNGSGAAYVDALSRAINRKITSIPNPTETVMGHILHSEKLTGGRK